MDGNDLENMIENVLFLIVFEFFIAAMALLGLLLLSRRLTVSRNTALNA